MRCNKCGQENVENATFCPNCGNSLSTFQNNQTPGYNNNQVPNTMNSMNYNAPNTNITVNNNQVMNNQTVPNNYNQPNYGYNYNNGQLVMPVNDNKNIVYICVAIILIAAIIIIVIIIKNSDTRVFIDESGDNQEITNSGSSGSSGGSSVADGQTVIDADRQYEMTISSTDDIYNKIIEDSETQKSQCPAKIKEIENRISKNYNITAVNLCEIDPSVAVDLEKVIKHIYEEYPSARGYLTNMTIKNVSMSEGYIAAFQPFKQFIFPLTGEYPIGSKMSIMLNSTYYLNIKMLESSMKNSSAQGHFPPNTTISSPMAHELGHYLSFISMMKSYGVPSVLEFNAETIQGIMRLFYSFRDGDYSKLLLEKAFNNYKKTHNDFKTLDEFRGSISGYAMAKNEKGQYIYDESIAESFHDTFLNGDNAKPASKEIVKVLKESLS